MPKTRRKYHKDPAIQKKIIALFTWYDQEKQKLSLKNRLRLLNMWVYTLADEEEYEIALAFMKYKKPIILRKLRMLRKGKRSFSQELRIILRIYKMRLKAKIKKMFS